MAIWLCVGEKMRMNCWISICNTCCCFQGCQTRKTVVLQKLLHSHVAQRRFLSDVATATPDNGNHWTARAGQPSVMPRRKSIPEFTKAGRPRCRGASPYEPRFQATIAAIFALSNSCGGLRNGSIVDSGAHVGGESCLYADYALPIVSCTRSTRSVPTLISCGRATGIAPT